MTAGLLVLAAGESPATADNRAVRRRFMSYNIQCCFGNSLAYPRKTDPLLDPAAYTNTIGDIAAIIRRADPEWVALQEVANYNTNGVSQTDILAEATGMHGEFAGWAKSWRNAVGGEIGVAILSKETPIAVRRMFMPDRPNFDNGRVMMMAEFAEYVVYATHLGFVEPQRTEQVRMIFHELDRETKPVFLVGDLNIQPQEDIYRLLQERFVVLTDGTGLTWNSAKPTQRLDYILVDKDHADQFRAIRSWSEPETKASDHRPIFLDIEKVDDFPACGVIAHRGDRDACPENTLPAFRSAVAKGAAMVELDEWRCKTGELVVMHDPTVDRTTDGTGAIADLTLAQIKALDAGSKQMPAYAKERVPTVQEALACFPKAGVLLNIHCKSGEAASEVAEILKKDGRLAQGVLMCDSRADLERLQARCPGAKTGLVGNTRAGWMKPWTEDEAWETIRYAVDRKVDFLQVLPNSHCTAEQMKFLHGHGVRTTYFVANDAQTMADVVREGHDFVFTDHYSVLEPVFRKTLVARPSTKAFKAVSADYDWIDGATLKIDGRGFDAPDEPYVRIPVRFEGKVPKAVFEMGRQSTGMSIRFKTTSRKLVVRWTLVPRPWTDPLIPPSGLQSAALWAKGDGDWEYVKKAHPAQDGVNELLVEDWEPGRTGLLYLPMRGEVKKLEIGFEKGAAFEALPPAAPGRIVHYGTSIVHGGCVSQPGMMFTSFMGRILDREVVNLGFSGNGRMEPEMADLLAEIDAALYIVDCDWNMTVDLQKKNYEPFVRKLHALRPETPILLCGGCTTLHAPREQEVFAKSVYDKLKAEDPSGWKDLHFLSGVGQLPFDSFATHDHVHPNDYGAPFMGKAYAAAVERILR